MIILDTNVVSGLMNPLPDGALLRWLDQHPLDTIWLTSITIMEVRFGIELLSHGRRRREISDRFSRLLEEKLQGRILSFDREAAEKAAEFTARRRVAGRPVGFRDSEIAGIVLVRGATLATRNVRDFQDFSIQLTNPWEDRP
jgi:toxin FitB